MGLSLNIRIIYVMYISDTGMGTSADVVRDKL